MFSQWEHKPSRSLMHECCPGRRRTRCAHPSRWEPHSRRNICNNACWKFLYSAGWPQGKAGLLLPEALRRWRRAELIFFFIFFVFGFGFGFFLQSQQRDPHCWRRRFWWRFWFWWAKAPLVCAATQTWTNQASVQSKTGVFPIHNTSWENVWKGTNNMHRYSVNIQNKQVCPVLSSLSAFF